MTEFGRPLFNKLFVDTHFEDDSLLLYSEGGSRVYLTPIEVCMLIAHLQDALALEPRMVRPEP